MQTRFILGPAGSGKTYRCLQEIREALGDEPDGLPLLLLAPKQTTFQLERQLLASPSLPGYTRLQILSFDRLAFLLFKQLNQAPPRMLDEEGRLMVLRSVIDRRHEELKLFHASARLTGFAQHLSEALRELQRNQLTPESLNELTEHTKSVEGLSYKLHDLATLLRDYLDWLKAHELEDGEHVLEFATEMVRESQAALKFGHIWLDGFTELSPRELELLAVLLPHAEGATLTFCLDHIPTAKLSWVSTWTVVRQTFQKCWACLAGVPNCEMSTELLARQPERNRFANNQVLGRLEWAWAGKSEDLGLFASEGSDTAQAPAGENPYGKPPNAAARARALRIASCATPEVEATLAAREILAFVGEGGRYRQVTVLARSLETYHEPLVNVFHRYEIPFFLDRRESVAHHPLAELTRNTLRTVISGWRHDDWFAALKTGLVPVLETDIDRLENEALARGWTGKFWHNPIVLTSEPQLGTWAEGVRKKIVPPFHKLAQELGLLSKRPTGPQLAEALRRFWSSLDVEESLRKWSKQEDEGGGPQPIHLTVWEQMNAWLDNLELAFPDEPRSLPDWLPVLEAGLSNLTVGVIPPALDQVLIGAVDRSRNPDIRLALVLGMNETVFPAPPQSSVLLTEADREALEAQGVSLGAGARQQAGQERFYGYVACTRARHRLVLTYCLADHNGKPLNPSPFLLEVQRLFPGLEIENFPRRLDWRESRHASELVEPLLRQQLQAGADPVADADARALSALANLPVLKPLQERLRHFTGAPAGESLSPELAAKLYGKDLRTSVSRMEEFAACPFRFFVHSGLRAEERKKFELDIRDQGNFQHLILEEFHRQLREEKKKWRDIPPAEGRERIASIAAGLMANYREGLMLSTEQNRFTARVLTEALQDFVETLIEWMREQYAFDPVEVELPFEEDEGEFPAWRLDLGNAHRLLLRGRIDRIDLCRQPDGRVASGVVVDYKSSHRQLDALLMEHGLQLQLPAYLNVLRQWPEPKALFGVERIVPAGVFYVNLRGRYDRGENRDEALADVEHARKRAYRHMGRFDAGALAKLDLRSDVPEGDMFNYRRNKDGSISKISKEALDSEAFAEMLNLVESSLRRMGQGIYAGVAQIDPYRKGRTTACDSCDYRSICRIDPWAHSYRILRKQTDVKAENSPAKAEP